MKENKFNQMQKPNYDIYKYYKTKEYKNIIKKESEV